MLEYQWVADFVSDSGMYYQDLVRDFYAHFTILLGCAFSSTVRGIEIAMSLEDFGACLGIPSEGRIISHGFTPDTEGWENFNNLGFYFSMSRISEQEFYARHAHSNSIKFFLSSKNLFFSDRMLHYFLAYVLVPKDIDGTYKHTNAENVYAPPPAPEGGYTLELLYSKIHEMDIYHSSKLQSMRSNLNFLKQQKLHHSKGEEEEEEEGDEENEEMEESD
ncbi:hypothetical protein KIW84_057689 [Lathyrus oleraceus]|uniref:Uncharacterized protein n=1 Tax=Pisum sativum TaxID=3888 RepID=A0A9D4X4B6_PEA|nr:hypothetical protein KIW84_057689 [Pisum sativum]